jgi:hypothetical protein
MGNLTKKVKKKKTRKARAKLISLLIIGMTVAFMQSAAALYLRDIYNVKTLLPSWKIPARDIIFAVGDLTVLKRDLAYKILVDQNVLVAEQIRLVATIALIGAIAYMLGKSSLDRISHLLFIGGLSGVFYYVFMFALMRWPTSLLAKDVIALIPTPIIVPVYIPLLLSAVVLTGGTFLVFKKK